VNTAVAEENRRYCHGYGGVGDGTTGLELALAQVSGNVAAWLQEINICWVGMILPAGKIRGHLHTGETLRPHLRRRKPCHELNVERVQVVDKNDGRLRTR
jgi:hypothetical protein